MKKIAGLFLCVFMLVFCGSYASALTEVAADAAELEALMQELVSEDNADSFFSEIVIDKNENTITKDGNKPKSLKDYGIDYTSSDVSDSILFAEPVLDMMGYGSYTDGQSGEIVVTDTEDGTEFVVEGITSVKDYNSQGGGNTYVSSYQLSQKLAIKAESKGDKLVITSPFQTKRLFVTVKAGAEPEGFYNAKRCISDGEGLYILQYGTEVEAKEAYAALKKDSSVKNVSIDKVYTASKISDRTGAKTIQSDRYKAYLKKKGKKSEIIVAVIDTGVDSDHPFLKSRLIKKGYNAYGQNSKWEDDNGHGTHVSGIIVDNTPSNVKILPIKVLGEDGSGSSLAVKLGIEKAVKLGADVINMSLGCICDHVDCPIEAATKAAIKKGVTVVVAAGNDCADTKDYCPASVKKCITVAAAQSDGHGVSEFSNYGSAVDITAPGANILSCELGGGYVEMSGTSMASPFVAAAVAMVLTNKPSLTPEEVEKKLITYVSDMVTPGKDIASGYGLLNFGKALGDKKLEPDEIVEGREEYEVHYFGMDVPFLLSPAVFCSDDSDIPTDRSYTVTVSDPSVLEYKGCLVFPKKPGKTKITFKLKNGKKATTTVIVEDSGSWLNVAAKSYAGGKGTKKDPYLIKTPEQLAKFALDCTFNNKRYSYKLLNDIDLKGRTWISANYNKGDGIFWVDDYEEVVFDGNNKKIKNMTVFDKRRSNTLWGMDESEREARLYEYNKGLFYSINDATVKNLGLDNAYSSHSDAGLLCYELMQNSKIYNCYTSGFSAGNGLFTEVLNYNVTVSNCYSSASVLKNGIAKTIYSSKTGKIIFNNVFFCGEQLDSDFTQKGAGFANEISNYEKYYTYLYNCFSAGEAINGIGFAEKGEHATIDSCYYLNKNSKGIKTKSDMKKTDLTAKSLSFFKKKSTYTDSSLWNSKCKWDFEKVWAIDGKTNNGFPYLKKNKPTGIKQTKTNTWLDYAAKSFAGGNGTKAKPYLISNAKELARLSKLFRYGGGNGLYFKLTKNIDLSSHNWFPIGAGDSINSVYDEKLPAINYDDEKITKCRFYGNIDGNGKTVSNMKISSKGDFIGFIAISENNEIRNLHFKNVTVSGNEGCGVIAGYNRLGAKIIACSVKGKVTAKTNEPLGGICGKNYRSAYIIGCSAVIPLCNENDGIIKNCYNPKGLFYDSDGVVMNCYTEGKIDSPVIYHSYCYFKKDGKKMFTVYDEVYGNIDKSRTVGEKDVKKKSTFKGWFSDNAWTIDTSKGERPRISSQKKYKTEKLPTKKWADVATKSFAGGKGTKKEPFLIATAEQLAGVKPYLYSRPGKLYYFRLTKNIDLSGRLWDSTYSGSGTVIDMHFDGNGKTVSGMTTENGGGLFEFALSEKGVIENLTLTDFRGRTACALVAMNYGTVKYCRVKCYNLATVVYTESISDYIGESWCGGIADLNTGTIANCEVDVRIFSAHPASGIAGYNPGTIKNCSVKGFIMGETVDAISPHREDMVVKNCYSIATVVSEYEGEGTCRNYKNSYSAADLTGEQIYKGAKYSSDLKKKSTYKKWDFEKVWAISEKKNGGYPYIRQKK